MPHCLCVGTPHTETPGSLLGDAPLGRLEQLRGGGPGEVGGDAERRPADRRSTGTCIVLYVSDFSSCFSSFFVVAASTLTTSLIKFAMLTVERPDQMVAEGSEAGVWPPPVGCAASCRRAVGGYLYCRRRCDVPGLSRRCRPAALE